MGSRRGRLGEQGLNYLLSSHFVQWAQSEVSHERPVVRCLTVRRCSPNHVAFVVARSGGTFLGLERGRNNTDRHDFDDRTCLLNRATS